MKCINNEHIHNIIFQKSNFICFLKNTNTVEDALEYIQSIKISYHDATHVCFGYIIENQLKYSDDGEPKNTAGLPILEVLKKNDLTNITCIVVRYYGGIKLGASGLIRAYSKSVSNALDKSILYNIIDSYILQITVPFDKSDILAYFLKSNKIDIINISYTTQVTYEINIPISLYSKLESQLNQIDHTLNIKKIKDFYLLQGE